MFLEHDTLDFVKRWSKKRHLYRYDRLANCFDRFFTAFVLYNFLYNHICENDPQYHPHKKDHDRATKAVKQFLGAATMMQNPSLLANASALKSLVDNQTFYIRDAVWDRERVHKLGSNDPQQWSTGLLEIVYAIRCNTFHGHKSFEGSQKEILVPCIKILELLNDMLAKKMSPNQRVQATRLPGRQARA